MTRIPTWFRAAARARGLTTLLGVPLLAVALIIDASPLVIGAGALLLAGLVLTLMSTAPDARAVTVAPPVSGPREGARPAFGGVVLLGRRRSDTLDVMSGIGDE